MTDHELKQSLLMAVRAEREACAKLMIDRAKHYADAQAEAQAEHNITVFCSKKIEALDAAESIRQRES